MISNEEDDFLGLTNVTLIIQIVCIDRLAPFFHCVNLYKPDIDFYKLQFLFFSRSTSNMSAKLELREILDEETENLLNPKQENAYDCTFVVGTIKTNQNKCDGSGIDTENIVDTVNAIPSENKFRALSSHLANISGFFRKQLFGHFKESKRHRDDIIYLKNCEPRIFQCILRASYNLMPNISADNVFELLGAADYFDIPVIYKLCQCWFKRFVTVDNVLSLLNHAYLKNGLQHKIIGTQDGGKKKGGQGVSVKQMCLKMIWDNLNVLVTKEKLEYLHVKVIEMIISDKKQFKVNQELIWDVLTHWAKYQASLVNNLDLESLTKSSLTVTTKMPADNDQTFDHENNYNYKTHNIDNDNGDDVKQVDHDVVEKHYQILSSYDYAIRYEQEKIYQRDIWWSNDDDCLSTCAVFMIQPLIKYIEFKFMSVNYFNNNVEKWLTPRESQIALQLCTIGDNLFSQMKLYENNFPFEESSKYNKYILPRNGNITLKLSPGMFDYFRIFLTGIHWDITCQGRGGFKSMKVQGKDFQTTDIGSRYYRLDGQYVNCYPNILLKCATINFTIGKFVSDSSETQWRNIRITVAIKRKTSL